MVKTSSSYAWQTLGDFGGVLKCLFLLLGSEDQPDIRSHLHNSKNAKEGPDARVLSLSTLDISTVNLLLV